ncbi:MAG: transglycosylase SLT domain-containing protein [Candidatus Gracilibacteria bacterium]|nr:transglycosylase SLT domain-containing protein [Candidatus Gracilibacteria bacterium]
MTTMNARENQDIVELQEGVIKTPEIQSNRAVFPDGKSEVTSSLEKTTDSIRSKLEMLYNLPATPERDLQIFNLERKRKRSTSFAFLQTKGVGTEEQKAEQKEILKGKDTLEKLMASDILLLKKKGVDLANLLLVPKNNATGSVSRDTIQKTDMFIVNFGENKAINNTTGAGDILPPNVNKIKINGVEGERLYTPRTGYYSNGKYLPIFDGDTIEIVDDIGTVDEKIASDSENKWFINLRIEDIINFGGKALSELPEDKKLAKEIQQEMAEMIKRREKYKNYIPGSKNRFLETFREVLDRETSKYGIPKDMLVNNLFEKENRSFDPFIKNPESNAYGLGQIINGTWRTISHRIGRRLDRENPEDQIIATCEYLNYIKELRGCTWGEAIVYYHTGEYFNDKHVRSAMKGNEPVVAYMKNPENPTAHDYITAAAKYYEVTEYMSA